MNFVNTTIDSWTSIAGLDVVLLMLLFDFTVVLIASMCLVFPKASRPAWAALVPFYNLAVLLQIVGRPPWWLALMMAPVVNVAVLILVNVDLARSFGKGRGFGLGLAFLSPIFFPILALGPYHYLGLPRRPRQFSRSWGGERESLTGRPAHECKKNECRSKENLDTGSY